MNALSKWFENHQMPCLYKKLIGIDCPGCGIQRSFVKLLSGDIYESFMIYPALVPLLFTLLFLILHLVFSFRHGAKTLMYSYIFTASVIAVNYVSKFL